MMGYTYDSAAEAEADRDQLKALHSALGVWDRGLQRDDCNAWTIIGKRGSIHTLGILRINVNEGSVEKWVTRHRLISYDATLPLLFAVHHSLGFHSTFRF
jgi:hypothetical protein